MSGKEGFAFPETLGGGGEASLNNLRNPLPRSMCYVCNIATCLLFCHNAAPCDTNDSYNSVFVCVVAVVWFRVRHGANKCAGLSTSSGAVSRHRCGATERRRSCASWTKLARKAANCSESDRAEGMGWLHLARFYMFDSAISPSFSGL